MSAEKSASAIPNLARSPQSGLFADNHVSAASLWHGTDSGGSVKTHEEAKKVFPLFMTVPDLELVSQPESLNPHPKSVPEFSPKGDIKLAPSLETSVFLIPVAYVKNREDRLVVLITLARGNRSTERSLPGL